MSVQHQTLQTGGHLTKSLSSRFFLHVKHGSRRCTFGLGSSRSHRPDPSRPAVGHVPCPLKDLSNLLSHEGALTESSCSSRNRSVGGAVGSNAWLPACVRNIVTALGRQGRRPMLQLVFSSRGSRGNLHHRFEAVSISQSLADNPQRWAEFSSHVHSSGANGLVLIRPIASPDQHCVYAAAAAAMPACGSACAPQPAASASATCPPSTITCEPYRSGPGVCSPPGAGPDGDVISGQVGTCCRGEPSQVHTTTVVEHQPQQLHCGQAGASAAAAAVASVSGSTGCDVGPTQYFGLVVQGNCSSEADGCWVLKTTRSDPGGGPSGLCSCTHWSLTRVCAGQPLYAQLRDAWLAR